MAVTTANCDDGTHASKVLEKLGPEEFKRLVLILGDKKYNNRTLDAWIERTKPAFRVQVGVRPEGQGFQPEPVRWVVEQSFACMGRYRRLNRDHEYETSHSEAWVRIAAISRMVRRLKPDTENPQAPFKYQRPPKKKVA